MNVIKEHKINNRKKGQVTFGSKHGGQWLFEVSDRESGKWTKMMRVPGGLAGAEKIAETLSKSWLRTAGKKLDCSTRIDAIARNKIDRLTKLKTLKDYTDEPEFWKNEVPSEGTESVPMNYVNQPRPSKGISAEDIAQDTALEHATESAVESQEVVEAVSSQVG
jgi:hypothetical protein